MKQYLKLRRLTNSVEINEVRRGSVVVGIGGYAIDKSPTKIATWALGSCVAIIFYDPYTSTGTLAHSLLPRPLRGVDLPTKYVSTAIPYLLRKFKALGIPPRRLQSALIGGANILQLDNGPNIGRSNVDKARLLLKKLSIPIVAIDVGGTSGRNVVLDLSTGTVYVWYTRSTFTAFSHRFKR
ncbi:MAG: chemotaxis protein CheD [Thermoprotei archaeon]|nr:MAG: chemotaxis protein CheD [Thermoprotei archaeon]